MAVLGEIDLTRNFNPMVLIRAREYERARKVLKAHIEQGGWIYGLVKGSDHTPHSQVIHYRKDPHGYLIEGDCTCPQGTNCKHVAAVLFHLIANHSFEKHKESPESEPAATNPALEKWLASVQDAAEDQAQTPEGARQELLFVVKVERVAERLVPVLQPMTAQLSREQTWKQVQHFRLASLRAQAAPRYLRRSDVDLLRRLETYLRSSGESASFDLSSIDAPPLLQQVLETGRCYWQTVQGSNLALGSAVKAEPVWTQDEYGFQHFKLKGIKGKTLPMNPPWYVNQTNATCGPLDTGLNSKIAQALCSAPSIAPENSARVRLVLGGVLGRNSPLLPGLKSAPQLVQIKPTPTLTLGWTCVRQTHSNSTSHKNVSVPSATLGFKYLGHEVQKEQNELRFSEENLAYLVLRDQEEEVNAAELLKSAGWIAFDDQARWNKIAENSATHALGLDTAAPLFDGEQRLLAFVSEQCPSLVDAGWEVIWDDGTPMASHLAQLEAAVSAKDDERFELRLTAEAPGESVDLRPILKALAKEGVFERTGGSSQFYFRTPSGAILSMSIDRLREIFASIGNLFGEQDGHELLLSKVRTLELGELSPVFDHVEFPEKISQAIRRLDEEDKGFTFDLQGFESILRPYQKEGVRWLGFLSDFGFGGILADDMGLGKTVQTLAHIQRLKIDEKLTKPVLIVAPTSTLPNWLAEIKRFVPNLAVLMLHGSSRKESFEAILEHDLVLTSYPLLVRDRDTLLKHRYSAVVLDEAQNIKNSSTHAAKVAYEIAADSKIALSGTPIENHLEELWSIFRFALPGVLGGQAEFRREFRVPIEGGVRAAKDKLERRIRPFFLRRTKEQVAPELPRKTEIIDYVSLEPAQRELYDAVALAADRQIRDSILSKGWDETRFEALNALLRLRQICCDPRLIKQENPVESSKLERLVSMLKELKDSGRRTLVFSQFTSMLDLIGDRLKQEDIEWVRLCGSTKDRSKPVTQFQKGDTPVFLISLKAGGVGLNLTAADTVIHYDPWWNPAVERQATDRAHRIGQDKPVFVYKLVAADTVEERILTLQQRKSELSNMFFSEDSLPETTFTPQDLQWMLSNSVG